MSEPSAQMSHMTWVKVSHKNVDYLLRWWIIAKEWRWLACGVTSHTFLITVNAGNDKKILLFSSPFLVLLLFIKFFMLKAQENSFSSDSNLLLLLPYQICVSTFSSYKRHKAEEGAFHKRRSDENTKGGIRRDFRDLTTLRHEQEH